MTLIIIYLLKSEVVNFLPFIFGIYLYYYNHLARPRAEIFSEAKIRYKAEKEDETKES